MARAWAREQARNATRRRLEAEAREAEAAEAAGRQRRREEAAAERRESLAQMRAHTQRILGAGRDYRQMLDVSSEAPKAEARRAYLTIQKYLNENGIKYSNLVNHREVTSSELAEAKEACQKLGDAKVMILEPDSTPARDLRRRDEEARQEQAAREEEARRERAAREREERTRERQEQE